ncbi:MAG: hypothetical protein B6229_07200 [Spirochaetaceae bacterium 4572_7]|nr:MAG: hypothetical protein B6229_07200 [Spirochaetaceae bacterium 4572_7]
MSKENNDISIDPSFNDLFEEEVSESSGIINDNEIFEDIKIFKGKPIKAVFGELYYKHVLKEEGEIAQRLHVALARFLKAKDPQDKTMFRGRLVPVVWELFGQIGQKVGNALSVEKKFFLRYALLLPSLINKDQKENIASIIKDNLIGEPIHYMDEWLEMVAMGDVTPLAVDEAPVKATKTRGDTGLRLQKDKIQGTYDGKISLIASVQKKRSRIEKSIVSDIKTLASHTSHPSIPRIEMAYSTIQKDALSSLVINAKELQKLERELSVSIQEAGCNFYEVYRRN